MKQRTAEQMRQDILATHAANGWPTTGDLWFAIVFRTDSELRAICHQLYIPTVER